MNSIFNYIAIKITSLITMPLLTTIYNMFFTRTLNRVSIMVPNMCAIDLKNNLTSKSLVVCDLDKETDIEIDEDDKHKKSTTGNTLNVSRTVYNKATQVVSDLEDIFLNTSNATNTILYISSDYRLLKYVGIVNIEYFMPSDAYHNELMKQKDWNESAYQVTKQDLVDRKKDKLHIYTSASDLQSQILVLYPMISIKI